MQEYVLFSLVFFQVGEGTPAELFLVSLGCRRLATVVVVVELEVGLLVEASM